LKRLPSHCRRRRPRPGPAAREVRHRPGGRRRLPASTGLPVEVALPHRAAARTSSPPQWPTPQRRGPKPWLVQPIRPGPLAHSPARLVGSRVLRVRARARPRCLAAQGGKGPRGDFLRRPAGSLKKTSLSEDSFKRCREPSCKAHGGEAGRGGGSKRPKHRTWPAQKDPLPLSQSKSTRSPSLLCISPGVPGAWVACRDLEPISDPQLQGLLPFGT
jgi:hypothetical protein